MRNCAAIFAFAAQTGLAGRSAIALRSSRQIGLPRASNRPRRCLVVGPEMPMQRAGATSDASPDGDCHCGGAVAPLPESLLPISGGDFRLDQPCQQAQRFLPAQIAAIDRNRPAEYPPARCPPRCRTTPALSVMVVTISRQVRVVKTIGMANPPVRHQLQIFTAKRVHRAAWKIQNDMAFAADPGIKPVHPGGSRAAATGHGIGHREKHGKSRSGGVQEHDKPDGVGSQWNCSFVVENHGRAAGLVADRQ